MTARDWCDVGCLALLLFLAIHARPAGPCRWRWR